MDWLKRFHERFLGSRGDTAPHVPDEHSGLDWFERFHEPFFHSQNDAESYVTLELAGNVPEGWVIDRSENQRLTWVLKKAKPNPSEWPVQEYSVRVTEDLGSLIFTYDNNDVGVFALHHALQHALVIDAVMLRRFRLGDCLGFLFANCKPNEWGYT